MWEAAEACRRTNRPKSTLFIFTGRRCEDGCIPYRKDQGLHGDVQPPPAGQVALAESEGPSLPHALLAGGMDYTTKGLARICKDGVDSICAGVRELEEHGYVIRQRVRNTNGQLGAIEYTILEQPRPPEPKPGKPERENPVLDNPEQASPVLGDPEQENPAQLNTKESSKDKSKKDLSSTEESNPILSSPQTPRGSDRAGRDLMRERESYRKLILENIEYDILAQNERLDRDRLDELVELMVDTVCSNREMIRVAGDDYPAEVVRSRFLKLNASHIEYVLDRMSLPRQSPRRHATAQRRGRTARATSMKWTFHTRITSAPWSLKTSI